MLQNQLLSFICPICNSSKYEDDRESEERSCKKCGATSEIPEDIKPIIKSRFRLGN